VGGGEVRGEEGWMNLDALIHSTKDSEANRPSSAPTPPSSSNPWDSGHPHPLEQTNTSHIPCGLVADSAVYARNMIEYEHKRSIALLWETENTANAAH
jgi:hypothetical protein